MANGASDDTTRVIIPSRREVELYGRTETTPSLGVKLINMLYGHTGTALGQAIDNFMRMRRLFGNK